MEFRARKGWKGTRGKRNTLAYGIPNSFGQRRESPSGRVLLDCPQPFALAKSLESEGQMRDARAAYELIVKINSRHGKRRSAN